MPNPITWLLALLLVTVLGFGDTKMPDAAMTGTSILRTDRLPSWALLAVEEHAFATHYDFSLRLNPFYLSGDFDSDH